jgi:hypothetical protein
MYGMAVRCAAIVVAANKPLFIIQEVMGEVRLKWLMATTPAPSPTPAT